MALLPIWRSASPNPTVVVVLPSPAGVGLIAVTNISFEFLRSGKEVKYFKLTFALYFPYASRFSASIPRDAPISFIGFIVAACAISISDILIPLLGVWR